MKTLHIFVRNRLVCMGVSTYYLYNIIKIIIKGMWYMIIFFLDPDYNHCTKMIEYNTVRKHTNKRYKKG